jgi:undecaprenyl-diphosphatase
LTRKAAAQYSFLLSAPIVGGAVVKTMSDIWTDGVPEGEALPLVVGIITSAFFGFVSIAGLMRYLQTRSTFVFINYRMALGICLLAFS